MTDQLQPGQHQQRAITTPTGGAPGYRLRHVKSLPPGGQRWDIVWDESQATACVWDGQQWICFSTGAGADCMFDYLVSSCFGDLLGFTEGQVFTSGPGCTFKGFSTVQGMYTAANGQGHRTAYVCGDNYNESPTINLASGDRLWVFGAGSRRTVIVGTHTLLNDGEGLYFQNIGFGSASVTYRTTDIFTSGGVNPDIDFNHCWLAGRFSCDATSFRFVDCDFQHGFLWHTQNTDQVMVYNSTIGDNGTNAIEISVSGDFRFEGIQLNRPALISAATCNGRFIAVKYGTGGTSQNWLRFNNNTAGRWMVDNCQFATPLDANGAIYIESVSGNFEIAIIANRFEKAAGSAFPFITSADASARAIIVGNMFLRDSLGNYVEDDLGVSISGSFTNSVFGPNYPATKARYNIAGADNEFYPGSSASGTSVPTNTDHDDLTNVTPDQHHLEDHAARHSLAGADEVLLEDLSAGASAAFEVPISNGAGVVAWGTAPIRDHKHTADTIDGGEEIQPERFLFPATFTTILTPAGGAITVANSQHLVDPGTIDTINGGEEDMIVVLRPYAGAVTFEHGTGNIFITGGSDLTLTNPEDWAIFIRSIAISGGAWGVLFVNTSGGGGGGHTIRENGTDQTARTGLNFVDAAAGAGLIADDAGGDETEVHLDLYILKSLLTTQGDMITRDGSAPKRLPLIVPAADRIAANAVENGEAESTWKVLATPIDLKIKLKDAQTVSDSIVVYQPRARDWIIEAVAASLQLMCAVAPVGSAFRVDVEVSDTLTGAKTSLFTTRPEIDAAAREQDNNHVWNTAGFGNPLVIPKAKYIHINVDQIGSTSGPTSPEVQLRVWIPNGELPA